MKCLPVAVIGAGPAGLAAVARLIERGIEPLLLEASDSVGASLRDYGHVRLFSPWRYDVDHAMAAQLEGTGWTAPKPEDLPLAGEIVDRVLQPYAALPAVQRAADAVEAEPDPQHPELERPEILGISFFTTAGTLDAGRGSFLDPGDVVTPDTPRVLFSKSCTSSKIAVALKMRCFCGPRPWL